MGCWLKWSFNSNDIKIDLNEFELNKIINNIYSNLIIHFLKYKNTKSINDSNYLKD